MHRLESRIPKVLRVRIQGVDRDGNPFVQKTHTVDLSRSGARLDSVGCLKGRGQTIQVRRGWQEARFRVAWIGQIGMPNDNQVGIRCLEPGRYIWGVDLPAAYPDSGEAFRAEAPMAEPGPVQTSALPRTELKPQEERTAEKGHGQRRSARVNLQLPVSVRWVGQNGAREERETMTLVVNEYGCVLPLNVALMEGTSLELINRATKEVRRGKVVWSGSASSEEHQQVAIELEKADPKFWGASYGEWASFRTISDTWVG